MLRWIAALILLLTAGAAAQQPKQPIVSGAAAIVVDAVVRDNRGNPVTDLRKEEFELIEDGVRQEIGDFTVVAGANRSSSPGTEGATASPEGSSVSFTAIVFNRLSPDTRGRAYQGALAALETLHDTDALLAITAGLAIVPGRKSVVFFSEGIPVPDAVLHHFRNVIGSANRANVSVYTLDAAGLRTGSEQAQTAGRVTSFGSAGVGDTLRSPLTTLEMLARETGGLFVGNTNDLTGAFRRVDADRRFYYLLTYTPKNTNFDGKWRTIAVKVPGRRVDIRARTGYLATREPGPLPFLTLLGYEAPALAALARSPAPADLPLRAAALLFPGGGQSRVAVLAATDAAALRFDADGTTGKYRTDFSILARVMNARGEVVRKASQPYRLSGPADQIDTAKRGEILFFRQPSLEAGTYTLEVAVHDALATRSSVHRSTFVVPETKAAALEVSSLVLVRRAERVKPEERDQENPLYMGDVLIYPNLGEPLRKSSDKAAAFFVVATAAPGNAPRASIEVLQDGRTVANAPAALPAAAPNGRIEHVIQLPLEQLPAGRYTVRLTMTQGAAREVRDAVFTVIE